MPDKKVTVAAIFTLSASRLKVSMVVLLVSLPGNIKSESGAIRSVTLPIITLITAYVPIDIQRWKGVCESLYAGQMSSLKNYRNSSSRNKNKLQELTHRDVFGCPKYEVDENGVEGRIQTKHRRNCS